MKLVADQPPGIVVLLGAIFPIPEKDRQSLWPPPKAARVRRLKKFCWVGEAIHPANGEWIEVIPRCWCRWAAVRWFFNYNIEIG